MSIINVNRDATFVDPEKAEVDWSTPSLISATSINTRSDGLVNETFGIVKSSRANNANPLAGEVEYIGLYMRPTERDIGLYRVLADVTAGVSFLFSVGYGASVISTTSVVTPVQNMALTWTIDKLIAMPGLQDGDTYFGRPIWFGIGCIGAFTGIALAQMSVQRLSSRPPQMAIAVT